MWLTDLLPQLPQTRPNIPAARPTHPTNKNHVGRSQTLMAVALSDTSDTSGQKKAHPALSGKNHQKNEEIAVQKSVLNVPLKDETDTPPPEQIHQARRMLVDCPCTDGKLHCWYCSRCTAARTCRTWLSRRADVKFFRGSDKPYSLILLEECKEECKKEAEGRGQSTTSAPDYAALCASYWRGCRTCPDRLFGQLRFCGRYTSPKAGALCTDQVKAARPSASGGRAAGGTGRMIDARRQNKTPRPCPLAGSFQSGTKRGER